MLHRLIIPIASPLCVLVVVLHDINSANLLPIVSHKVLLLKFSESLIMIRNVQFLHQLLYIFSLLIIVWEVVFVACWKMGIDFPPWVSLGIVGREWLWGLLIGIEGGSGHLMMLVHFILSII